MVVILRQFVTPSKRISLLHLNLPNTEPRSHIASQGSCIFRRPTNNRNFTLPDLQATTRGQGIPIEVIDSNLSFSLVGLPELRYTRRTVHRPIRAMIELSNIIESWPVRLLFRKLRVPKF